MPLAILLNYGTSVKNNVNLLGLFEVIENRIMVPNEFSKKHVDWHLIMNRNLSRMQLEFDYHGTE